MGNSLKQLVVAVAAGSLVFTAAACSDETTGTATKTDNTTTTATTDPSESPSTDTETTETDDTAAPPSGDQIEAQDGSFTTIIPAGYIDAEGQTTTTGAILELAETEPTNGFNTTIIVASSPLPSGTDLDTAFDQLVSTVEKQQNATAKEGPTGDVDGEPAKSYTIQYEQGGIQLATAQVMTIHDGTAYFFTVNCDPSATSAAGEALADVLNAVTWS